MIQVNLSEIYRMPKAFLFLFKIRLVYVFMTDCTHTHTHVQRGILTGSIDYIQSNIRHRVASILSDLKSNYRKSIPVMDLRIFTFSPGGDNNAKRNNLSLSPL